MQTLLFNFTITKEIIDYANKHNFEYIPELDSKWNGEIKYYPSLGKVIELINRDKFLRLPIKFYNYDTRR